MSTLYPDFVFLIAHNCWLKVRTHLYTSTSTDHWTLEIVAGFGTVLCRYIWYSSKVQGSEVYDLKLEAVTTGCGHRALPCFDCTQIGGGVKAAAVFSPWPAGGRKMGWHHEIIEDCNLECTLAVKKVSRCFSLCKYVTGFTLCLFSDSKQIVDASYRIHEKLPQATGTATEVTAANRKLLGFHRSNGLKRMTPEMVPKYWVVNVTFSKSKVPTWECYVQDCGPTISLEIIFRYGRVSWVLNVPENTVIWKNNFSKQTPFFGRDYIEGVGVEVLGGSLAN